MRKIFTISCAAVLLSFVGRAPAGLTTFADHTFADSDWSATKAVDSTVGQVATFSARQAPAGGNADAFRATQHNLPGLGAIVVSQLSNASIYNPIASGQVESVDVSYDLIHINPPEAQAVAYAPLLEQSGVQYQTVSDLIFTQSWTSFSHNGLLATDFVAINGDGSSPDFSASAAPIQFGFASANSNSGGGALTRDSGIDNWSVTIHSRGAGPSAIPLPPGVWGGLLLLAAGAIRFGKVELKRLR